MKRDILHKTAKRKTNFKLRLSIFFCLLKRKSMWMNTLEYTEYDVLKKAPRLLRALQFITFRSFLLKLSLEADVY